jgi:hypothetical protein
LQPSKAVLKLNVDLITLLVLIIFSTIILKYLCIAKRERVVRWLLTRSATELQFGGFSRLWHQVWEGLM